MRGQEDQLRAGPLRGAADHITDAADIGIYRARLPAALGGLLKEGN